MKKIINGTLWTTTATVVMAIVQILRLSILTKFIEKADFGVVAVLTLVMGLCNIFCDLGFATAIMHKKDISSKEFSSLYWIQFGLLVSMYLFAYSLTGPVSVFYEEPLLEVLLPITMLELICMAVGRLYEVMLQKTFQFKIMAIRNIISSLLSLLVAIVLAVKGAGIYSLVLSTLFNTIFLNLWNLIAGYKTMPLKIYCSIKDVVPLVKIGIYQTGTQVLDYISTKIDIIILGKMLGSTDLGVYSLAKELVLKALEVLNGIASKVTLPFFASIQNDVEQLKNRYCQLISILAFVNMPICVLIGSLSIPIVNILYGDSYMDVAPLIAILSIWGMSVVIGKPVGNIVISTGRTDLSFRYTIYRLLIFIPFTYILSSISLYAISYGQILLAVLGFVLSWYMLLYRTIGLKFFVFVKSFISVILFSVVLICVIYSCINNNVLSIDSSFFSIVVYAIIIVLSFAVYIMLLEKQKFIQLVNIIKK